MAIPLQQKENIFNSFCMIDRLHRQWYNIPPDALLLTFLRQILSARRGLNGHTGQLSEVEFLRIRKLMEVTT
jgi:hypothetical protein